MTIVLEVGPTTVQGPHCAENKWVSAGIDGIDDELILVDDRAVDVADVWHTIIRDVLGGPAETVAVVCPTWWSSVRVERVAQAARTLASDVVVMNRAQMLVGSDTALVETAPEFIVVSTYSGVSTVVARDDVDTLVAKISMFVSVVVDGPLTAMVADRLRLTGVAVVVAEAGWVRRGVEVVLSQDESDGRQPRSSISRGATAVLAGTLLSAAALCGGYLARPDMYQPHPTVPTTLLIEGRFGVMVPARWSLRRITAGPGSARVQVISPDDGEAAVHITQSSLAPQQSHEQVVQSLRRALSEAPDGVFVEFDPAGSRAGRSVLTYREVRANHRIAWFVLMDGTLRMAIGCQSAPGRDEAVRDACDQAIRSAHAVF